MATNSNSMAYNAEEIKSCINNIVSAYEDLLNVIEKDMQSKVIQPLSESWYAENAKSYWDEEVSAWNSMCGQIQARFNTINDMVNTCASNYATAAGTTWSKIPFTGMAGYITNEIQATSGDGRRGIVDIDKFNSVKDSAINSIYDSAETALGKALSACESSGFIDSSTEETIRSIINTIKTNIASAINTAKEDIVKNSGTAYTNYESAKSANASASAN